MRRGAAWFLFFSKNALDAVSGPYRCAKLSAMEWFESEDFWRDFYPFMFSAERFAAAAEDVNQILALTQCDGGSVLDLCCSPGRHSVEFARRDLQVTGVDRSPFLLERARAYAAESGISMELVQEDMRNFVRPQSFDLACNLFTSFGYFKDERENVACCKIFIRASNRMACW